MAPPSGVNNNRIPASAGELNTHSIAGRKPPHRSRTKNFCHP